MAPLTRCFLSLGSNQGDRLRHLRSALGSLQRLPGTRLLRISRVYETAPVGVLGQRPYLNLAAEIRTSLSPMGLLLQLKSLEADAGRRPGPRWGPRPLDIDILSYGGLRLRTPHLSLPHPRARERRFVLAPLAELSPAARAGLRALKAPGQHVRIYLVPRRR